VLGRFKDRRRDPSAERPGRALERNNSGALRPGTAVTRDRRSPSPGPQVQYYDDDEDDDTSQYPEEDKTAGYSTMYRFDNGSGGRETMYTGRETMYSEYSRASFLDVEKSEKARGQLVDRVGVMFDLSGRERSVIPPVPRLPSALAAGVGNRF